MPDGRRVNAFAAAASLAGIAASDPAVVVRLCKPQELAELLRAERGHAQPLGGCGLGICGNQQRCKPRFRARHRDHGVREWVHGDEAHAASLWRSLARDTEFEDASRVIRRLYLADSMGKPILFRGRIEKLRSEGHWQVTIDGRRSSVDLIERDFRLEDLRPGREVRDFAIAFNYLGPIADPASRYGGR